MKNRVRVPITLLVCAGLWVACADEEPEEPGPSCAQGEVAVNDTCLLTCDASRLCPGELVCVEGLCLDLGTAELCGEGAVRVGEDCLALCDGEADCGADEACASGLCVDRPEPLCGVDEVPVEGSCVATCAADADCPAGQICREDRCEPGHRPDLRLVSPPSGTVIGPLTEIVIRFDTSMASDSLTLSGELAAVAAPSWSSDEAPGDTVTLSPDPAWPEGNAELILDAASSEGVALEPLALHYAVDAAVPTVGAVPASGTTLGALSRVEVRFGETMSRPTLELGGELADEAATDWASTVVTDDTLVVTPLSSWTEGTDRTLDVTASDLAGNSTGAISLVFDVDATLPLAEPSPPDGSEIAGNQEVVITFSESMDPASLVLGGDLAAAAVSSFERDAAPDDRLVIEPRSGWSAGDGQTLTIEASDIAGNALSALALSYDVDGTSPTATISPEDESRILPGQLITVRFSESMDPATLELSGTLASRVDRRDWSAEDATDDTLTLSPSADGWRLPAGLTIRAADPAGNPLAPLSVSFEGIAHLPLITVPVHAVRAADDDGSRACGITPEEVALWVEEANRVYAVAGIHFTFDARADGPDWTEVDNTLVNQMTGIYDAQWDDERDAANQLAADVPGKLLAIFRYGPGPGPTGGGFSWTDYDFIAMPGFSVTGICGHQNIHVLPHEMGHYLGLAHPFSGVYGSLAAAETAFTDGGRDPMVFDGDRLLDTPADPYISTAEYQCQMGTTAVTLDGVPFLLPRFNIMSYYDSDGMTLSAEQIWAVRQGALVRTGQSLTTLLPGDVLPPIEGEALVAQAEASAGFVIVQSDMRAAFLGLWSGDAQLFWGGAEVEATDRLALELDVTTAGAYRVFAIFTEAPDFGMFRAEVNGHLAAATIDLFNPRVRLGAPVDLGTHELLAGSNELAFDVIATDPDANPTAYAFGLDAVLLERLE